jgi:hypothetical protein
MEMGRQQNSAEKAVTFVRKDEALKKRVQGGERCG